MMMTTASDPRALAPLVDLLYESMLDRDLWPRFLEKLCETLDASAAQLISSAPINRDGFWIAHGIDPSAIVAYDRYFQRIDPLCAGARELDAGDAHVIRGDTLDDDEKFLSSEFYVDFLAPLGLRWIRAVQVRPAAPMAPGYALCLFRGPDQPRFDEDAEFMLSELGRHLLRIERVSAAAAQWHFRKPIEGSAAVFFLSAQGRLLQCNAAGESMIDKGLVSAGERSIGFGSQEFSLWLHGFVGARSRVAEYGDRHTLNLSLADEHRYELEMIALNTPGASPMLRVASLMLVARRSVAKGAADPLARRFSERYRWTPSEADAVRRLAAGARLADIAKARESSIETVRSHLKSAKRKAGVKRQMDLVRLVLESGRGDTANGSD